MSEDAQRLEETLVMLVLYQSTGALEVIDDKKKWQFYFDNGELVGTKSNLKSETEESLRKTLGDLPEPEMAQAQATRRIANACRAAGATSAFQDGTPPARPAPCNVRRALFEAVSEVRDEEALRLVLAPLLESSPVANRYELLGTGPALDAYLTNLDGSRPAEDVIDFAPVEPQAVLAGLWLAWRLEIIGTGEAAGGDFPDEVGEEHAASPEAEIDDDDLSTDLIEEEPEPAPQPAPSQMPGPVLTGPGRLLIQAHEIDMRAVRSAEPAPVPVVSPVEEHPMAGVLRALEGRIENAKTHFDLLGESWESSPDALRTAYMRLARDLHPDRYGSAPPELRDRATELFDRVRAAWEVVGEEESRQQYIDHAIHGKKTEEELAMEQVQQYLTAESEFKRALAAFNAGQVSQALPLLKSAVERAPEEVEFRGYLGFALFYTNFKKDVVTSEMGMAMLKDALERNANQERKRDTLWVLYARAWREKGDAQQARRAAASALRINPSNPDAVRILRRLEDDENTAIETKKSWFVRLVDRIKRFFKKLPGGE